MHQILKFDLSPKDVKIKTILNKEFLELEMYAISDIYPNRNTSTFTEQSLIDSKHTCYNKPILGCFNVVADDFEEHNGDLKYDRDFQEEYWDYTSDKTEKILGVIRESDNVEVVNYENQNWLKITCAIWTMYSYKQVKKLLKSTSKKVSVEVLVTKSHTDEQGILVIEQFILTGITILGDKISEGIPNAHLNVLDLIRQKDFSGQMKCLSFAYNQKDGTDDDIQLDNMSNLYKNNLQMEGTQVTYREKWDFLDSRLTEAIPNTDDGFKNFWLCDFSDEYVIIHCNQDDKYYKISYTMDDEQNITFDLDNKVEQVQTFKDFVEKTIEFEGEQKTIEEIFAMYSDSVNNYSVLEKTYNDYKEEMSQKVYTVIIDEQEYDINQVCEKFNADIATKEESIQTFEANIAQLNSDLETANQNFADMETKFNNISEELNNLKATMAKAEKEQIREQGCKMVDEEDGMEEEDKKEIKEKCEKDEYSSIQEVEDAIAKAVYKKYRRNRQTNAFKSNIVHDIVEPQNEKQDVFGRLENYSKI